jgi:hypothetical protein
MNLVKKYNCSTSFWDNCDGWLISGEGGGGEGAGLIPFKLQGRTWSGGRGSQCPTPDFPTNIPLKEPISDTPTVRRAVLN